MTVPLKAMNGNNFPSRENESSGTDEQTGAWADLGRRLAVQDLEAAGMDLSDVFYTSARAVEDGTVSAANVRALYDALDEARLLVDELAETVPDAERQCRLEDVVTGEELREFAGRFE